MNGIQSIGQKLAEYLPADILQKLTGFGSKLAISILIFLGFIIVSLIVNRLICRVSRRTDPEKEEVLILIGSLAKSGLLLFGAVTALGTLGVNVSALVAGLGLTGFALGFAFRDALSNVLAGVMILMYRPFYRGDHVAIMGLEGEVVGIDLRYTTLRKENTTYLIPNSLLLTNALSLNRST